MKIRQLKLKNFAQFEDFEIVFNDDITHLVGINGSGKTTVGLNAIWAGFKGIAEKSKDALIGERYRFISPGKKSLDIEITLHDNATEKDIILKRHITKDVNQISIESSGDDAPFDKQTVENLLNVTFLSASHFTSLSGKEQALALGIDTTGHDESIADIKSEAQLLRKQIKSIGDLPELEKVDKVSVSDLIEKRDEIVSFNNSQNAIATAHAQKRNQIDVVKAEMQSLSNILKDHEDELATIADSCELKDTDELDEQIENAEETNELAVAYENNKSQQDNKNKLEEELAKNKTSQETKQSERLEYIKSSAFGMKGLSVDDTGSLLLDEKPIKSPYFSKGELEMAIANISSGLNPDLKVRFIDDFEVLDEENQRKIIKGLTKRGFQIITATVGDKKTRDKSVLLRQCKIVE